MRCGGRRTTWHRALRMSLAYLAAALAASLPMRALAADGNPFAGIDAVSLFRDVAGAVAQPRFGREPQAYALHRLDLYGTPVPSTSITGRVRGGTWVLISAIDYSGWIVYRWSGGRAVVAGALHGALDATTVTIEGRSIVQTSRVYAPDGQCGPNALLKRRYDIVDGALREIVRETVPPHFATADVSPLPREPLNDTALAAALAERTVQLYRSCLDERLPYRRNFLKNYVSDDVEIWGSPYGGGIVRFGPAGRLIAVPFLSGGNGGVFTAAVYRIDRPYPIFLRALRSNGHMVLRARDDLLEMFSPEYGLGDAGCCASHYDMSAFRYDTRAGRLLEVGSRTYRSETVFADPHRLLPIKPAIPALTETSLEKSIARISGIVVERSATIDGVFYWSERYGFYGRPDPDAVATGTLRNGTRVMVVPFENRCQAMIFRQRGNVFVPVASLTGPGFEDETVTVEAHAIVQRSQSATVTYALQSDRLIAESRFSHQRRSVAPRGSGHRA